LLRQFVEWSPSDFISSIFAAVFRIHRAHDTVLALQI
jgi:hypothetical protein